MRSPVKIEVRRQPELIPQAIKEVFGDSKDGYCIAEDKPNTIEIHDTEQCVLFNKKLNELRGIESNPNRRYPIFYGKGKS